jgi:hypothetical protein
LRLVPTIKQGLLYLVVKASLSAPAGIGAFAWARKALAEELLVFEVRHNGDE